MEFKGLPAMDDVVGCGAQARLHPPTHPYRETLNPPYSMRTAAVAHRASALRLGSPARERAPGKERRAKRTKRREDARINGQAARRPRDLHLKWCGWCPKIGRWGGEGGEPPVPLRPSTSSTAQRSH
eukprot:scaffold3185_cov111-Isochrysis_galbana.AAC.3